MADAFGLTKATGIQQAPPTGAEGARTALNDLIEGLRGAIGVGAPDTSAARAGAVLAAAAPLVGAGRVPAALEGLFEAQPEAKAAYEAAQGAQEAEASNAAQAGQRRLGWLMRQTGIPDQPPSMPSDLDRAQQANQALKSLQQGVPRPIITSTGMQYSVPVGRQELSVGGQAPISPTTIAEQRAAQGLPSAPGPSPDARLAQFGMTKDIVQDIRNMTDSGASLGDIQRKYPHLRYSTVRGIASRDSFGWVPDSPKD